MAGQLREPRAYELMTIFLPDLSDEDGQAQLDTVSGYITSADGSVKEILTDSPWGRRRLAYTIRFNGVDYRDGIYSIYHFDAAPSAISQLERDLKLDTNTMRYLLVHDDPKVGEKYPPQNDESGEQQGETASEPTQTSESSKAATGARPEPEPEIADSKDGDPATTEAAAEEKPAETLTDDAVSAMDEPETEPAPEQLDPDSSEAPEDRIVEEAGSEPEGETSDDAGTAPEDDESTKE